MKCECGGKLKVVKTIGFDYRTFRNYKCKECGKIMFSKEVFTGRTDYNNIIRKYKKVKESN